VDLNEIMWESLDWIHVTQDRSQWRTVVNTIVNLRLPQWRGVFFLVERRLLSRNPVLMKENSEISCAGIREHLTKFASSGPNYA